MPCFRRIRDNVPKRATSPTHYIHCGCKHPQIKAESQDLNLIAILNQIFWFTDSNIPGTLLPDNLIN